MQRVADGQNRHHPPSSFVAATRLPRNPSDWNHSAPFAKEERRTRRREYKKEGNSAGKKTERKEQVLILKRAAMRGGSRTRTDWVVLSPLIVSRSTHTHTHTHTLYIRARRRARHRMVSACDGSPLQGSVKSHPDAGPPTFISVSADVEASIKKVANLLYTHRCPVDFLFSRSMLSILRS